MSYRIFSCLTLQDKDLPEKSFRSSAEHVGNESTSARAKADGRWAGLGFSRTRRGATKGVKPKGRIPVTIFAHC